jgi:hypothetical protein
MSGIELDMLGLSMSGLERSNPDTNPNSYRADVNALTSLVS